MCYVFMYLSSKNYISYHVCVLFFQITSLDVYKRQTYNLAKHLTGLLKPHIGQTDSFVRDSSDFLWRIRELVLEPGDVLVSFDVVSLFTMVPVQEVLGYLGCLLYTSRCV